ncbi:MAG: NADH-quinone oxidoreductase subunit NuoK [Candidatus Methanomethylicia archaeon]
MIPLFFYLFLSFILLSIGIIGLTINRNIIKMLLSLEVMFNSSLLLLLSLSTISNPLGGSLIAIFSITLAGAEVGVLVSILIMMFRVIGDVDVFKIKKFRG